MNINDITITSLETITAFDCSTGAYKFTLDELQSATIAQTQGSQEVTGKQGRKLASLKRNKAVTISGNNGLVSGGLLELQTGGKFENKSTEVLWVDYLTVTGGTATTSYVASGTPGSEMISVRVRNADGTRGEELTQNDIAAPGKFAYNPSTKVMTFDSTDIASGTEIVVHYNRRITADVLENMSDSYSGKCMLYIDALAEDKCANIYRIQFFIPKADFNGEFSFEMGDNQTVHAFEAEALAGACGAGGSLWTYTIFGVNTEDSTTTVNEEALNTAIAEAAHIYVTGNIDNTYTADSWGAFKNAYDSAAALSGQNLVLTVENQASIDAAVLALNNAIAGLAEA